MSVIAMDEERYIGTSDVPDHKTFQSSERRTDVTAYNLSDQWGIILARATRTLKNTMQNIFHSAVLLLDRRYHMPKYLQKNPTLPRFNVRILKLRLDML